MSVDSEFDERPRSAFWRAIDKIREVGPVYALALTVQQSVVGRSFYAARTLVFEVRLPSEAAPNRPDSSSRWGARSDSALLGQFGQPVAELERRLARGDQVALLQEGERLVGYVWFTREVYDDSLRRLRFEISGADVWLYDAMVAPSRRGEGLYRMLFRFAAEGLAAQGCQRIWLAVDALNRPSVKVHRALGGLPSAQVDLLRLPGLYAMRDDRGWQFHLGRAAPGWRLGLPAPSQRLAGGGG